MDRSLFLTFLSIFFYLPAEFLYSQASEHLPITLHPFTVIEDSEDHFVDRIGDAAITSDGSVLYTSRSQHKVFVFNRQGKLIHEFGKEGRGPAEFDRPQELGLLPDGTIAVYDFGNKRISVWDAEYQHITEFDHRPGWNTHFLRNRNHLFVWGQPYGPIFDGQFAMVLYKVNTNPWRTEKYRTFLYDDYNNQHEILSTWSNLAVTDDDFLVASEGTREGSYHLYLLDDKGESVRTFGREVPQPMYTPEQSREIQETSFAAQMIEASRSGGARPQSVSDEIVPKPYFQSLQLDERDLIWAHRNKEFGDREEMDIYTLEGEYVTTVTIPPSTSYYRLVDIRDGHALFHVTDEDEAQSLHLFRIEYSG